MATGHLCGHRFALSLYTRMPVLFRKKIITGPEQDTAGVHTKALDPVPRIGYRLDDYAAHKRFDGYDMPRDGGEVGGRPWGRMRFECEEAKWQK